MKVNIYCMLMRISPLFGLIFYPVIGLILPILMWAKGKNKSEKINKHGRKVFYWIVFFVFYNIILMYLSSAYVYDISKKITPNIFTLGWLSKTILYGRIIGFNIVIILYLLPVASPIIGAVKAYKEKVN